jgi:hypothetical protein
MVVELRRHLGDARNLQVHDADLERESCRLSEIEPEHRRWYDSLEEAMGDLPYGECPWCVGGAEGAGATGTD